MRTAARFVAAVTMVAAIGCTSEEPLETRATKYWQARQARDAMASFEYEHPDTRGTEAEYLSKMASAQLPISAAAVEKIEIDGDTAKVTVRVTYRHALMPRDVKAPIVDLWQKTDGRWYHKPPPAEFIAGGGLGDEIRRGAPAATPGAKP